MYYPPDGPAVVRVNIFVRSISKIDDVTMVSARNIKLNNNKIKKKKSKIKSLPSKNNNNNSKKPEKKSEKYCLDWKRTHSALTSPMSIKVFHCACLPVYVNVYCPSNSSHMRAIELSNRAHSLPAPLYLCLTLTISYSLPFSCSLSISVSASVYLVRVLQYK